MRASVVMALAVALYVLARWEKNEPAVTLDAVLGGIFAILVIAMLDQGKTEQIARGFAWLFFVVAAYNAIPAFSNALKSAKSSAKSVAKKSNPIPNVD
jgi:hypothetical protein